MRAVLLLTLGFVTGGLIVAFLMWWAFARDHFRRG